MSITEEMFTHIDEDLTVNFNITDTYPNYHIKAVISDDNLNISELQFLKKFNIYIGVNCYGDDDIEGDIDIEKEYISNLFGTVEYSHSCNIICPLNNEKIFRHYYKGELYTDMSVNEIGVNLPFIGGNFLEKFKLTIKHPNKFIMKKNIHNFKHYIKSSDNYSNITYKPYENSYDIEGIMLDHDDFTQLLPYVDGWILHSYDYNSIIDNTNKEYLKLIMDDEEYSNFYTTSYIKIYDRIYLFIKNIDKYETYKKIKNIYKHILNLTANINNDQLLKYGVKNDNFNKFLKKYDHIVVYENDKSGIYIINHKLNHYFDFTKYSSNINYISDDTKNLFLELSELLHDNENKLYRITITANNEHDALKLFSCFPLQTTFPSIVNNCITGFILSATTPTKDNLDISDTQILQGNHIVKHIIEKIDPSLKVKIQPYNVALKCLIIKNCSSDKFKALKVKLSEYYKQIEENIAHNSSIDDNDVEIFSQIQLKTLPGEDLIYVRKFGKQFYDINELFTYIYTEKKEWPYTKQEITEQEIDEITGFMLYPNEWIN